MTSMTSTLILAKNLLELFRSDFWRALERIFHCLVRRLGAELEGVLHPTLTRQLVGNQLIRAQRVRAQIRHGRASKDWNLPNAEHAGPRSVQDHESARAEQVQVRTQPGRAKEKSRVMPLVGH